MLYVYWFSLCWYVYVQWRMDWLMCVCVLRRKRETSGGTIWSKEKNTFTKKKENLYTITKLCVRHFCVVGGNMCSSSVDGCAIQKAHKHNEKISETKLRERRWWKKKQKKHITRKVLCCATMRERKKGYIVKRKSVAINGANATIYTHSLIQIHTHHGKYILAPKIRQKEKVIICQNDKEPIGTKKYGGRKAVFLVQFTFHLCQYRQASPKPI